MDNNKILDLVLLLIVGSLTCLGNANTFGISYILVGVVFVWKTLFKKQEKRRKVVCSAIYLAILGFQLTFSYNVIFYGSQSGIIFFTEKLIGVVFMYLPFAANSFFYFQRSYFPSVEDITTVSFESVLIGRAYAGRLKNDLGRTKDSLRINNITEIIRDIPRHSSTKYINQNTLTDEFFDECTASLEDENIYIAISNTGSPASEIISVFTKKNYNHVSLSFDKELKTILSYNGGENVYPPGLNREQLEFFNKKADSSIIVYKLATTRTQKLAMIEKIREINQTGSAYNLLGLITKATFRPNIMFCSQFVYNLLTEVGLDYFKSNATEVKPTDLVEKDYYRELKYCYEIKFSDAQ